MLKTVSAKDFCLLGNLYSKLGINYIIRNIFAHPRIRHLVVCGADRSGSGQALVDLFRHGVDSESLIIGHGIAIDKEIERDIVDLFRREINLVDLRGAQRLDFIKNALSSLEGSLPPFLDEPLIIPKSDPQCFDFPAEKCGFVMRSRLVSEVWLKLVGAVMNFGRRGPTDYGMEQKELIDVVAAITAEDPENIHFVDWFPFNRSELDGPKTEPVRETHPQLSVLDEEDYFPQRAQSYYDTFLEADAPADLSYTYGYRLFRHRGVDQIKLLVERLKKSRISRRAMAVLWDPAIDASSENPPCLCLLQARLLDDSLLLTAYFRSHDIYRAWPQNAFALRKLQKLVADDLGGCGLGDLAIISHSAHIYQDCWGEARKLLAAKSHELAKASAFEMDPRGNFSIRVEGGEVVVEHYSQDERHLNTFRGKNFKQLQREIAPFASSIDHAIYLGSEIEKALLALKQGLKYVQDQELYRSESP